MFTSAPALDILLRGLLLAGIALLWVILLIRIVGLRSLSKMSPFDFVITVATGSLLAGASQASEWSGFIQILIATASLFGMQFFAALIRKNSSALRDLMQNEPVFLFQDGHFNIRALEKTRVTKSDVFAKLREANALHLSDVHAVVLETTGDISVLHGSLPPDKEIVEGVIECSQ